MQTSLCKSQGGVPDSGNYCDGPADLQCCVKGGSGKITRDEVIARSQDWVNRRIPYSQTDLTGAIVPLLHVLTSAPSLSFSLAHSLCLCSLSFVADGYRQDCSGMVSMAWRSSTAGGGHWTGNLQVSLHSLSLSYHLLPLPPRPWPRRRSVTRSADLSWLEEISF
jgi:hypothetical protein